MQILSHLYAMTVIYKARKQWRDTFESGKFVVSWTNHFGIHSPPGQCRNTCK